jgi:hypothetical protein
VGPRGGHLVHDVQQEAGGPAPRADLHQHQLPPGGSGRAGGRGVRAAGREAGREESLA